MANFFRKIIAKFQKKAPDLQAQLVANNLAVVNKSATNEKTQAAFNESLKKSASSFAKFIHELAAKTTVIDQNFVDQLETVLLKFDMGVGFSQKIVKQIVDEIKYHQISDPEKMQELIVDQILINYIQDSMIACELNLPHKQNNVILVMGANGVGKTTTIAKLAYYLQQQNKKVLLIAGDSFRAGAVEQLQTWAQRLNLDIIVPQKHKQDPSSVIYQGLTNAQQNPYDVILCDTSGRLHNKVNLMNELKKIHQTIKRFISDGPHETLLILDATIGQAGLLQAEAFHEAAPISGIILTKMDSSAKGGIIFAIKDAFNLPVKFLGLGEKLTDFAAFDLEAMVNSITNEL